MKYKGNYVYSWVLLKSDQDRRLPFSYVGGHILLLACEGNIWFSDLGYNKESFLFFWSS